jgi:hypothetical protein
MTPQKELTEISGRVQVSVRMMNSDFVRPIQHDITGREAIENPAPGRFTGQDERSKQSAKFTRDGEHTDAPSNGSETISTFSFIESRRPRKHAERDPKHSPHPKSFPTLLFERFVRIPRARDGLGFASISAHARDILQPLPEVKCVREILHVARKDSTVVDIQQSFGTRDVASLIPLDNRQDQGQRNRRPTVTLRNALRIDQRLRVNRSIKATPSFVIIPLITDEVTDLHGNPNLFHDMDRKDVIHGVKCFLVIQG